MQHYNNSSTVYMSVRTHATRIYMQHVSTCIHVVVMIVPSNCCGVDAELLLLLLLYFVVGPRKKLLYELRRYIRYIYKCTNLAVCPHRSCAVQTAVVSAVWLRNHVFSIFDFRFSYKQRPLSSHHLPFSLCLHVNHTCKPSFSSEARGGGALVPTPSEPLYI